LDQSADAGNYHFEDIARYNRCPAVYSIADQVALRIRISRFCSAVPPLNSQAKIIAGHHYVINY
jgi:hypothetical protein